MATPVFADYIDWANAPFTDAYPTNFTALPNQVTTRSCSRGRQSELEAAQTGKLTLAIMDDDRSFDPENAASSHYPNVLPMRHVHETATVGGTTYDVFDGWVDVENGWSRDESQVGMATVGLPCNDGFELLQVMLLPIGYSRPREKTGTRITAILTTIGFLPNLSTDIDAGQEYVEALPALTVASPALDVIRTAEATEPGLFFFDHRGYACFHDRIRWQSAPYTVSQATFCDKPNYSGGRILYETLTTRQSRITNDVHIQWGGGEVVEADATSIAAYGTRSQPAFTTAHTGSVFADYAASWRLAQLKDTYTRYEDLTLQPGTDTVTWQTILSLKVADRITVIRTPNGGGASVTKDCRIQAISLTHGPGTDATWTARLAPADVAVYPLLVSGPRNAGTGANFNDGGNIAWATPGNATGVEDGAKATSATAVGQTTQKLRLTNFGFAIPGGATIKGIYVEILRSGNPANDFDSAIFAMDAGAEVGTAKTVAAGWPSTLAWQGYGSLADFWGLGGAYWTPAKINAVGFGVSIKGVASGAGTFGVDAVRIAVAYV